MNTALPAISRYSPLIPESCGARLKRRAFWTARWRGGINALPS
jgi:hypothetical protein